MSSRPWCVVLFNQIRENTPDKWTVLESVIRFNTVPEDLESIYKIPDNGYQDILVIPVKLRNYGVIILGSHEPIEFYFDTKKEYEDFDYDPPNLNTWIRVNLPIIDMAWEDYSPSMPKKELDYECYY